MRFKIIIIKLKKKFEIENFIFEIIFFRVVIFFFIIFVVSLVRYFFFWAGVSSFFIRVLISVFCTFIIILMVGFILVSFLIIRFVVKNVELVFLYSEFILMFINLYEKKRWIKNIVVVFLYSIYVIWMNFKIFGNYSVDVRYVLNKLINISYF